MQTDKVWQMNLTIIFLNTVTTYSDYIILACLNWPIIFGIKFKNAGKFQKYKLGVGQNI